MLFRSDFLLPGKKERRHGSESPSGVRKVWIQSNILISSQYMDSLVHMLWLSSISLHLIVNQFSIICLQLYLLVLFYFSKPIFIYHIKGDPIL